MNFESPLKQKKPKEKKVLTKEESKKVIEKLFKKPKAVISVATAKKILGGRLVDSYSADWLADHIQNWIRSESLPPQLYSNSFLPLLYRFLGPKKAEESLARIRLAYSATFGAFLHTEESTDKPESNTHSESDDSEVETHPDTIKDLLK